MEGSVSSNYVLHLRYCLTQLDTIWAGMCTLKFSDELNHNLCVTQIDLVDFLKGTELK
jgi:hypothetical protein